MTASSIRSIMAQEFEGVNTALQPYGDNCVNSLRMYTG
jgi:hypothetical protein